MSVFVCNRERMGEVTWSTHEWLGSEIHCVQGRPRETGCVERRGLQTLCERDLETTHEKECRVRVYVCCGEREFLLQTNRERGRHHTKRVCFKKVRDIYIDTRSVGETYTREGERGCVIDG